MTGTLATNGTDASGATKTQILDSVREAVQCQNDPVESGTVTYTTDKAEFEICLSVMVDDNELAAVMQSHDVAKFDRDSSTDETTFTFRL